MSAPSDNFDGEELLDLFENAPCGYLLLRSDGRIVRCNATFSSWLRRQPGEIAGTRFTDWLTVSGRVYYDTHLAPLLHMQGFLEEIALDLSLPNGSIPVLANATMKRLDGETSDAIRLTLLRAKDRRRYEQELLEARRRAEAATAELSELNIALEHRVTSEVSSRLQAEDALRQAQKLEAIGQLTGGIAHDFNNMLAGVIGSLDMIKRRMSRGDMNVSRFLEGALESAHRAAALTARLLQFSRQSPLEALTVDVNKLVGDMEELLRRTLGETIQIETQLSPESWMARVDPVQLENVILNLAVNARDAMPKGGKLTFRTQNVHVSAEDTNNRLPPDGDYVTLAVADTGTGIPPEILERVFEPFFTTKPAGKGTGLGLSQVYGFAKQSGGNVEIDSGLGRGTTVKLYLPRDKSQGGAKRPLTAEEDLVGGRETILVVEDEDRVREFAVEALRDLGYQVLAAADGAQALKLLADREGVDLLFTDIVMPGMSGGELAEYAAEIQPGIRVLFASGYGAGTDHGRQARGEGECLKKPYSLQTLAQKTREALTASTSGPGAN